MMESRSIKKTLQWPREDLAGSSILSVEKACILQSAKNIQELPRSIRQNTSGARPIQRSSFLPQLTAPSCNTSLCASRSRPSDSCASREASSPKPQICSVNGNRIVLANKPKANLKKNDLLNSIRGKEEDISEKKEKDIPGKTKCVLSSLRPINIAQEKSRFFSSSFTHNPQFKYENPALSDDLGKRSIASNRFLKQAIDIMQRAINKYGSYEKYEKATGGSLLSKSQILLQAEKYMEKEGCLGEIAVHLTDDMICQASMSEVKGRPTMTINVSVAREKWLEGTLRHEIGTHYYRMANNKQQPWYNSRGREQYGLKPSNPTEEGLASLHSVLTNKNPFLWRAALLYYTVYQASQMSFSELFKDLAQFVEDPNTRWHYCMRAKRGCTDTSQPGCCSKDQVYLDGILHILRHRDTIDFRLLTCMGQVSYEDIHRLKQFAVFPNAKIPQFLKSQVQYKKHLMNIMKVNGLTDKKLRKLIK
ncbi:putative tyrosine carboxypeptidase MATCAP2 [Pseudophryne corroboree]|uniref:putative tyrosine carboxypeptidase MATCAP2 n=1 Tax=Pseudophryne corroboree TaxID=495146 RepID=UPI003081C2D6